MKQTIIKYLSFILLFSWGSNAQVTLEKQIKISDKGLFFDGRDVEPTTPNNGNGTYDFVFGSRITPHGDCIKEYGGFVFMTWYRGGKQDRHVMLSRYNTATGVTKTIEFPHRHNGFQNQWWLGESHNTIAVGVSPIDGTIHMLYDMHAYDENKPSNGSLANDYFRYTYSKKDAATVPDSQFNINQFVKNSQGGYKHLQMRAGNDAQTIDSYKGLTYPNFFTNKQGELFMWIREGGNNNGAYKFSKYDGNTWSKFTQFNVLDAKNRAGVTHNWGLYGDIKFSEGKMRIGFASRLSNNNDKYKFNNGFHYAYSDDQNGLTQWKDFKGNSVSLPILNPEILKISEPGDLVPANGANSVIMSGGADWITTKNEDIHFVSRIKGSDDRWVNVHTYKKASANEFTTATNFPGGDLYTFNGEVYLIGLTGGRIFVEKAPGGTNNWQRIYLSPQKTASNNVIEFRHGNVYIDNGKIYFYMMERASGNSQPIYLQILDLGLEDVIAENQKPNVSITAPQNGTTFNVGQEITLSASANDPDSNLDKVNFKINDNFYQTVGQRPFETTFTPTEAGTYKIAARAIDKDGLFTEVDVTIEVVEPNRKPTVSINNPIDGAVYNVGDVIELSAGATDPDRNLDKVNFKINNTFYATDSERPFETTFTPDAPGTYIIAARAFDTENLSEEKSVTIEVVSTLSNTDFLKENVFDQIKIYPSPTKNIVNISGLTDFTTKAFLIDINGKVIKHSFVSDTNYQILVSELPAGVYFLKLEQDTFKKTISFVKK